MSPEQIKADCSCLYTGKLSFLDIRVIDGLDYGTILFGSWERSFEAMMKFPVYSSKEAPPATALLMQQAWPFAQRFTD